jgi:hypothetical protein
MFIRLHVAALPGNTMGEKSTVELLSRVHDDYWITGCSQNDPALLQPADSTIRRTYQKTKGAPLHRPYT